MNVGCPIPIDPPSTNSEGIVKLYYNEGNRESTSTVQFSILATKQSLMDMLAQDAVRRYKQDRDVQEYGITFPYNAEEMKLIKALVDIKIYVILQSQPILNLTITTVTLHPWNRQPKS